MPLIKRAAALARETRFPRIERDAQRLAGEVAFSEGRLAQTEEAWHEAYVIAQRLGTPLGPYLADLARLRAQQAAQTASPSGEQEPGRLAQELINEALALGGRGVELAVVEVYLALGMPAEARKHVAVAYKEAWADGPPYAFYHELKRIRAAIQTLGMPEPQLPPFDPAHVPPVPYEDEIRAFIAELERENAKANSDDADDADDAEELPALNGGHDLVASPAPIDSHDETPSSNGKPPRWQFWRRK
jgi:hypothetical protein